MSFEAPAAVYDRLVGRYSPALASAFLDAADVRAAGRALDVGCGAGALAAELARRLGARAVAAVDPSESFVAASRERLPGVDVRLAAAESLPFEDGSFDAVCSQLVVNFVHDPDEALAEMRRVARPGGTVAACTWDYADGMTLLRTFWDAALELDPEAPDEGRTMRFCTEPELRELWERGGLRDVRTGSLLVHAAYEDFDDLWEPFPSGLAPSGAYCAALEADAQERVRDACDRLLGRPRGPFELAARAWYAVGAV